MCTARLARSSEQVLKAASGQRSVFVKVVRARKSGDGVTHAAVGYGSHDPVILLSVSAISTFDNGFNAKVRLTGDRLTITVGGYLLTCQRDGRQADFPPAQPT